MMKAKLVCALVVLSVLVQTSRASLLSSAVVNKGQHEWQPSIGEAAEAALKAMSSGKSNIKLKEVNMEQTQVTKGLVYTLGLEIDIGDASKGVPLRRGLQYELSFLDPNVTWQPLWLTKTLPSSDSVAAAVARIAPTDEISDSVPIETITPELKRATLQGPMEIYLTNVQELRLRTPRTVDLGPVSKITLGKGVALSVSGMWDITLRESVPVSVSETTSGDTLYVDLLRPPQINLAGHIIEFTNASATQRLKVRPVGKSGQQIEIIDSDLANVNTPNLGEQASFSSRLHVPINDTRLLQIQHALQQVTAELRSAAKPKIKRLLSGHVEAVTAFLIPLEVEDVTEQKITKWEVVVLQSLGSNNKPTRVVSLQPQRLHNDLTFSFALMANGTLSEMVQDHFSFSNTLSTIANRGN